MKRIKQGGLKREDSRVADLKIWGEITGRRRFKAHGELVS